MKTISYIKYNNGETEIKEGILNEIDFMGGGLAFIERKISDKGLEILKNMNKKKISELINKKLEKKINYNIKIISCK